MRVMGLDIGTKRIGVAISDESATIAQAREVVLRKNTRDAIKRITEIANENNVEKIIIGLPVNMDGTLGERAIDSKEFALSIGKYSRLEVELWDERLSTKEAEDIMIEADISRKKRKQSIDKLAAQIILQSYLDRQKRKGAHVQKT